jgi:hypothetical protein
MLDYTTKLERYSGQVGMRDYPEYLIIKYIIKDKKDI